MRSLPRTAVLGLAIELLSLGCFGVVFAQLGAVEQIDENAGGMLVDTFEARLARRWLIAGIALMVVGTVLVGRALLAANAHRD